MTERTQLSKDLMDRQGLFIQIKCFGPQPTKQQKEKKTMFLAAFLCTLITIPWGGFVLATLWGWFIVPVFGLPALTVWTAAGILIVWSMFLPTPFFPLNEEQAEHNTTHRLVFSFTLPLLALVYGFAIKAMFLS